MVAKRGCILHVAKVKPWKWQTWHRAKTSNDTFKWKLFKHSPYSTSCGATTTCSRGSRRYWEVNNLPHTSNTRCHSRMYNQEFRWPLLPRWYWVARVSARQMFTKNWRLHREIVNVVPLQITFFWNFPDPF